MWFNSLRKENEWKLGALLIQAWYEQDLLFAWQNWIFSARKPLICILATYLKFYFPCTVIGFFGELYKPVYYSFYMWFVLSNEEIADRKQIFLEQLYQPLGKKKLMFYHSFHWIFWCLCLAFSNQILLQCIQRAVYSGLFPCQYFNTSPPTHPQSAYVKCFALSLPAFFMVISFCRVWRTRPGLNWT